MIGKLVRWSLQQLNRDFLLSVSVDKGIILLLIPISMKRYFETRAFKLIETAAWFIEYNSLKTIYKDSTLLLSEIIPNHYISQCYNLKLILNKDFSAQHNLFRPYLSLIK
jgi:hypothetical protein